MSSIPCPIATVINFCSNDYPFLRHCVDAVLPFSSQVIVPVCDHFFDGRPEDKRVLSAIYAEAPEVDFIEFPYDEKESYYASHSSVHWHNLARMAGIYFLDEKIEYVLFLDCDEIADTARFMKWLGEGRYLEYEALRFSNYWYFRESRLQAKSWEASPLLARRDILYGAGLMRQQERGGIYYSTAGKREKEVKGDGGMPMFHHYSWVRTKEQLVRKAKSWGHNWERDWMMLIEEEFSRGFSGTDFVHGYEFVEVEPFVEIDLDKKPGSGMGIPKRVLTHDELLRIDVSLTYQI